MVSIQNQTVLITGASSGIGAACAHAFAQAGARLILVARRLEKLEQLAADLADCPTHLVQLDVCDRPQVASILAALPPDWSAVDILLNNAGLSRGLDKLHEGNIDDWEAMINTNIKGLLYVTRSLLPGMVSRAHGHVINIGSIAGHQTYPNGNVYCATKAAVKVLSEGLKMDLLGTSVRVSSVDPGMGDTERAKQVYKGMTPLTADDIAEIVVFCATRPPHVNLSEVIVLATDQGSATMVHRQS
jgi:3-hydroxy acid dehydrogenase / malonic semialdehyde reductase